MSGSRYPGYGRFHRCGQELREGTLSGFSHPLGSNLGAHGPDVQESGTDESCRFTTLPLTCDAVELVQQQIPSELL